LGAGFGTGLGEGLGGSGARLLGPDEGSELLMLNILAEIETGTCASNLRPKMAWDPRAQVARAALAALA
jgi:hypothetical protein